MGIVVIGAVFVDIKGYPLATYIPGGRNAGRVEQVHGGVCRNVAEDIANVELRPTFVSLVDDTGTGQDVIDKLARHKVNTRYIQRVPDGMGTWLAVFNNEGDVVAAISKRPDTNPLTDLLDEVPIDSARFFFNQRESSSTLDFDLDLAVRNDSENPVYYVQYAHARICSVLKKLEAAGVTFAGADALDASLLTDPSEQALLRLLSAFPAEIAAAAEKYDPARITRYVIDIATAFHRFYNACRILEADPAVRQCRMALCLAVRSVIRNVLTMFKVTVPESM